jgi:hypothetical protein
MSSFVHFLFLQQLNFEKGAIDPIIIQLLAEQIENLENLLCQPGITTILKVKLYELLSSLI